jgi:radical SAM superfamily enzyme YgiQ (UPF0313 family)
MTDVLFVNSNMVFPSDTSISGRPVSIRDLEKVVNLGLLSIASYLDSNGVSVKIIDLVGQRDDLDVLRRAVEQEQPRVVGVSCISCFAYPNLKEYARLIKSLDDNIFVIAGGQHLSGIPALVLAEAPDVDCVVKGEGEYICHQIITRLQQGKALADVPSIAYRADGKACPERSRRVVDHTNIPSARVDLNTLPFLRYDLYPDFRDYAPHVEESRWCVFDCLFCTSDGMSRGISYKSIPRFVEELAYVKSLYQPISRNGNNGKDDLRFFFACSTFGLKKSRIEELIREMRAANLGIRWRTETRVDSPVVEYLGELAEVGLSVLDLGLESASPRMLRLMNKCRNPDTYLAQARKFIENAGALKNLLLKINLIFYPGETPLTVRETLAFLMNYAEQIDGISAGPVMLYPSIALEDKLPSYAEQFGTQVLHGPFWDRVHAHPVDPSSDFSFDQLNMMAQFITKMFCTMGKYFQVKQYGQLPRSMDLNAFQAEMRKQESHQWPFHSERKEWKEPRVYQEQRAVADQEAAV